MIKTLVFIMMIAGFQGSPFNHEANVPEKIEVPAPDSEPGSRKRKINRLYE